MESEREREREKKLPYIVRENKCDDKNEARKRWKEKGIDRLREREIDRET